MKLFIMVDWELQVEPLAWGLSPFKKLLDNDKSSTKEIASKEMQFIWHYADIKSDYDDIMDDKIKIKEIRKDLKLPSTWKLHKDMKDAIAYYIRRSDTTSSVILRDTLYTAKRLSALMRKKVGEEDLNVGEITKLTTGIKQMPGVIEAIQKTEEAVLREKEEISDKVGSQQKALYEEGLKFEED